MNTEPFLPRPLEIVLALIVIAVALWLMFGCAYYDGFGWQTTNYHYEIHGN